MINKIIFSICFISLLLIGRSGADSLSMETETGVVYSGITAKIPIKLSGGSGLKNIYSLEFTLNLNNSNFKFVNFTTDSSITSLWGTSTINLMNQSIVVVNAGAIPFINTDRIIGYIEIENVSTSAGDTAIISFANTFLNEGTPALLFKEKKITLLSAPPIIEGTVANITLNDSGIVYYIGSRLGEKGILSLEFQISVDSANIRIDEISLQNSILSSWGSAIMVKNSTGYKVAMAGSEYIKNAGVLFAIKVASIGVGGTYPITISNILINEDVIVDDVTSGKIKIPTSAIENSKVETNKIDQLHISPNPTNHNAFISWNIADNLNNRSNLGVYNIAGQNVLKKSFTSSSNSFYFITKHLTPGTYIVRIQKGENILLKRMHVVR